VKTPPVTLQGAITHGLQVLPIVKMQCSVSEDMIDAIASLLSDENLTFVRTGRY